MSRKLSILFALLFAFLAAGQVPAAEGRTPVYLDGTVIPADGRYILTRNIVSGGAGAPVIDIGAANVDLDLNGFTLTGAVGAPVILLSAPAPVEVRIYNGTIVGGDFGIDRPPAGPGQTVMVEDIKFEGQTGPAIHLSEIETANIRRINVVASGGPGVHLDPLGFFTAGTITESTFKGAGGAGSSTILLESVAAMEVSHNRIEVGSGTAIELVDSVGNLVGENTISDAGADGIFLRNSKGNKIYNNVIRHAFRMGILLGSGSSENLVLDNVATDCGFSSPPGHGLAVRGSLNKVDGNTFNSNESCGMFFGALSFSNTFGSNTARGNGPGSLPCTAAGPCLGLLFPPDSCDTSGAANDTSLRNMIPGPPPF